MSCAILFTCYLKHHWTWVLQCKCDPPGAMGKQQWNLQAKSKRRTRNIICVQNLLMPLECRCRCRAALIKELQVTNVTVLVQWLMLRTAQETSHGIVPRFPHPVTPKHYVCKVIENIDLLWMGSPTHPRQATITTYTSLRPLAKVKVPPASCIWIKIACWQCWWLAKRIYWCCIVCMMKRRLKTHMEMFPYLVQT